MRDEDACPRLFAQDAVDVAEQRLLRVRVERRCLANVQDHVSAAPLVWSVV